MTGLAKACLIDGKAIAARVLDEVRREALALADICTPGIAVVIVGDDPASQLYVASKERAASTCGFHSIKHVLPSSISEGELLDLIAMLNRDDTIHAILVQLPLPVNISERAVIRTIDPAKDVDGFHPLNVGLLAAGDTEAAFVPCTPAGAMRLIATVRGDDLSGLDALVIGRSNIVGKPMARLLIKANATVTIAHSRTADLPRLCRGADIVVAAVGQAGSIDGGWLKPGATVIDVGINRVIEQLNGKPSSRVRGDVEFETAARVAGHITPVPGGVGPMTIAMLMSNTLKAALRFSLERFAGGLNR